MNETRIYLLFGLWIIFGIYALLWLALVEFDLKSQFRKDDLSLKLPSDVLEKDSELSRIQLRKWPDKNDNKKIGLNWKAGYGKRSLLSFYNSDLYKNYEPSYPFLFDSSLDDSTDESTDEEYWTPELRNLYRSRVKYRKRRLRNRRFGLRRRRRRTTTVQSVTPVAYNTITPAAVMFKNMWYPSDMEKKQYYTSALFFTRQSMFGPPWMEPNSYLPRTPGQQNIYFTTMRPTTTTSFTNYLTTLNYYKPYHDNNIHTQTAAEPKSGILEQQLQDLKQMFNKEQLAKSVKQQSANTPEPVASYGATVRLWNYRPQAMFIRKGNTTVLLRLGSTSGTRFTGDSEPLRYRQNVVSNQLTSTTSDPRVQMRDKWEKFYQSFQKPN